MSMADVRPLPTTEPAPRSAAFEADLGPQELDQLRAFMATYAAVRDAPSGLSGSETVGHALRALAIPGVAFFIAVMVEVYAERLLDQFLP